MPINPEKDTGFPETRMTGIWKPPDVGAGNQTSVLYLSSKPSYPPASLQTSSRASQGTSMLKHTGEYSSAFCISFIDVYLYKKNLLHPNCQCPFKQ